ncbi:helix-turn-helix transcriptional regulator [Serratia fonticola]|uniref:helix-turn-helix transcriptional regulator n=1 Tax=Serratia fonticola TaxID=47917 RepID=UPI0015C5B0B5|nr:helix-turn-helix transcriptional regulator [Serratia fonticola]MBC3382210.1 helix-turn-helix transcriptional regulator [Serratia fonticola]NYA41409.1 helix-turn-helix transcriptional regulator [Serratia fonticola]
MSRRYFFSDDFFFLNGMREYYKDSHSVFDFINTCDGMTIIKDAIKSSRSDDVFILAFECKQLLKELLLLDSDKYFNFVIVIDTPLSAAGVAIGRWVVTSKFNTYYEMDQAIRPKLAARKQLFFTEREKEVWTLLRSGLTVYKIAKDFRLSPKTVYGLRSTAQRKISFERRNELVYIKYGGVFHG